LLVQLWVFLRRMLYLQPCHMDLGSDPDWWAVVAGCLDDMVDLQLCLNFSRDFCLIPFCMLAGYSIYFPVLVNCGYCTTAAAIL
jgi:hypothetical protein